MDGLAAEWEALTKGAGAVCTRRDVVRVFGADAAKFLQTQLSQDVLTLASGEARWSFILSPKGRVEALVRVWGRLGDSEFLLDVEVGAGERVVARLNRFRIRTKVEVEMFPWDCISTRSPLTGTAADSIRPELSCEVAWPESTGLDMLGPSLQIPEGMVMVGDEAMELLRIERGWPSMSCELAEQVQPSAIPGELGHLLVEQAVSFTKGCYTGQELVVRTHSRGDNTPRQLRRLEVEGSAGSTLASVEPGTAITIDGEVRGVLTSLGRRPDGTYVGLGFLNRAVGDNAVGEFEAVDSERGSSRPVEVKVLSRV